jgi:hypothetical protein
MTRSSKLLVIAISKALAVKISSISAAEDSQKPMIQQQGGRKAGADR